MPMRPPVSTASTQVERGERGHGAVAAQHRLVERDREAGEGEAGEPAGVARAVQAQAADRRCRSRGRAPPARCSTGAGGDAGRGEQRQQQGEARRLAGRDDQVDEQPGQRQIERRLAPSCRRRGAGRGRRAAGSAAPAGPPPAAARRRSRGAGRSARQLASQRGEQQEPSAPAASARAPPAAGGRRESTAGRARGSPARAPAARPASASRASRARRRRRRRAGAPERDPSGRGASCASGPRRARAAGEYGQRPRAIHRDEAARRRPGSRRGPCRCRGGLP